MVEEGGKVIVCSDFSSELYVFNAKTDGFNGLSFTSELTATEKNGTYPDKIGSMEEFASVYKRIMEEVAFMFPVWDEEKNFFIGIPIVWYLMIR